ncbi:MAG TPA: glycosyltransferase family 4 protein [Planctomycetota bacterium]|nr:glycosyltransferase family 4 protein [Planctomycetota bacterium]
MAGERLSSLHVNTEVSWRGGEQQVLHLLEGLTRRGLRAELAARPGCPLAERAAAAGVAVHPLSMWGEWDLAAALRLAGIMRRGRFGILHLHTSHAHGLGRLASLAAGGARVVVSRRVVFPVKGGIFGRLKYRSGIDKYIAISYAIRDALVCAGVAAERVAVVPSGVDASRFDGLRPAALRAEFGLPAQSRLVGVVGHLAASKGQQDFLAAAAIICEKFPDARFLLVGEGESLAALKRQAAELGIDSRVVFTGFRTDVPAVLAGLDVFVMPSHAEGLCTAAIEAQMAGCAVVATDAGGLKEVVQDMQTGLAVSPGSPGALAEAICRLLADDSLRSRLGAAGRARAMEFFTVEKMVDGTRQVYECLAKTQVL